MNTLFALFLVWLIYKVTRKPAKEATVYTVRAAQPAVNLIKPDAIAALEKMGFNKTRSAAMVDSVMQKNNNLPLDTVVTLAIQNSYSK